MRALIAEMATLFVAGCSTAPVTNMTRVWDHKYNQPRYVAKADSEFVGTSATTGESAKRLPNWHARGHP